MEINGERKLVLQPRDLEILRCCYEQQFLVYDQIEQFIFRGVAPRIARRRILRLKEAGLLRVENHATFTAQHILRVTEVGRRMAKGASPFEVPQSKKVDSATLTHDRIVTDVRLRLSALWDGVWTPEKALKDKYSQIPDGLFQFEGTGTTVVVEIENSQKGKSRFLSILKEWQRVTGVLLVLYVATDHKLFDSIKTNLERAPSSLEPAFGLVTLDSLMLATPRVYSPRGMLDVFDRRVL